MDEGEQLLGALRDRRSRGLAHAQREGDVVGAAEEREERVVQEAEADVASPGR